MARGRTKTLATMTAPYELALSFKAAETASFGLRIYSDDRHFVEIGFDRGKGVFVHGSHTIKRGDRSELPGAYDCSAGCGQADGSAPGGGSLVNRGVCAGWNNCDDEPDLSGGRSRAGWSCFSGEDAAGERGRGRAGRSTQSGRSTRNAAMRRARAPHTKALPRGVCLCALLRSV